MQQATAQKLEPTPIQFPARKFNAKERLSFLPKLAGPLMMQFEAAMYVNMTQFTNNQYNGGYWQMYEFPNGALMMVFEDLTPVHVTQPSNYYEGTMSMLVLSMALNLHLCSNMSFHPKAPKTMANNYHLLMENFYQWADEGWPGVPAEFREVIAFLD